MKGIFVSPSFLNGDFLPIAERATVVRARIGREAGSGATNRSTIYAGTINVSQSTTDRSTP